MIYGIWSSAAGMAANRYRLDVSANNMANIDTVGFKHDLGLLAERPVEAKEGGINASYHNFFFDRLSGGTMVAPTMHSFAQGSSQLTNKPLDAMIEGKGFFQIQTPDGERYTRDGRFTVDDSGTLVTVAGAHPVLSEGGTPITMGSGERPEIDQLGRVAQGSSIVGKLAVVEFDDVNNLRKIGQNLFIATNDATPQAATSSQVVPGMLEGSTVSPVNGIARMIEIMRSYDLNSNVLKMQDHMLGKAVSEIARF